MQDMQNMLSMQNKICIEPRTRWAAGLRSNAAVDIFGRGTAVTLTLFSSGNAEQAVPCRNQIDVIMEFTLRICRLKYAQYAEYAEYDQYVIICKTICKIWTPPFYMAIF